MKNDTRCQIQAIPLSSEFKADLIGWLGKQAQECQIRWLLVFADDGVIWGEVQGNKLRLAESFAIPRLRESTLQEARLFGQTGELLIWKRDKEWQARIIKDNGEIGEQKEYYDQQYLLWGKEMQRDGGFVLLREGSRGMQHAPPIPPGNPPERLQISLTVRHYLEYDPDGQVYVAFSRLVSLNVKSLEEST